MHFGNDDCAGPPHLAEQLKHSEGVTAGRGGKVINRASEVQQSDDEIVVHSRLRTITFASRTGWR